MAAGVDDLAKRCMPRQVLDVSFPWESDLIPNARMPGAWDVSLDTIHDFREPFLILLITCNPFLLPISRYLEHRVHLRRDARRKAIIPRKGS
jgi:hypothetical protein